MSPNPGGKILRLARALAQLPGQDSADDAEPHAVPHGAYFWAAQMTAAIQPLIVWARREAFGRPTPPFDTADQANDWLKRIYYPAREAQGYEQAMLLDRLRPDKAPSILGDSEARAAAETVRAAVERIMAWTGWRETAAVGLILLRGYRVPDTFRWSLEGPTPGDLDFEGEKRELDELKGVDYPLLFRRVTLTLRPWHLMQPRVVHEVLDKALAALGRPRRVEKLSDRDRLLLDVITVIGTLPPTSVGPGHKSGGKSYWEQAYVQWQAFGGSKCRPGALAKRLERLPQSVKRTLLASLSPRNLDTREVIRDEAARQKAEAHPSTPRDRRGVQEGG